MISILFIVCPQASWPEHARQAGHQSRCYAIRVPGPVSGTPGLPFSNSCARVWFPAGPAHQPPGRCINPVFCHPRTSELTDGSDQLFSIVSAPDRPEFTAGVFGARSSDRVFSAGANVDWTKPGQRACGFCRSDWSSMSFKQHPARRVPKRCNIAVFPRSINELASHVKVR